jgi:hypothetical protein
MSWRNLKERSERLQFALGGIARSRNAELLGEGDSCRRLIIATGAVELRASNRRKASGGRVSQRPDRTSGLPRHQVTGLSQPETVAEVAARAAVTTPGEGRRFRQGHHVTGDIGPRCLGPCGIQGVQPIPQ